MSRLLTAIGLIIVALYLVFWSPKAVFLAAAVLMGCLCYREFSGLISGHGILRPGWLGILAGVALILWPEMSLAEMGLLVVCGFVRAIRFDNLRDVLPQVASCALGAIYCFVPWHFAAVLRATNIHLLFFALSLNWAGDSVAYYIGRRLGKHKLAPIVSPKKSWEGAVASVAGSVILGVLYLGYFVPALPAWKIAVIAMVSNVAGQFGDLAESAVKRGAGVKDSGNLLPGHGGMLDRVDSSLFALPVAYVLVLLLRV